MEQNALRVVLDSNANIVDFECNLLDVDAYTKEEVLNKNWFELFIDPANLDEILEVFKNIFNDEDNQSWKSYKNDIKCKDGSYHCIDFENYKTTVNGNQYVVSIGKECFSKE